MEMNVAPAVLDLVSKQERDDFMALYPEVLKDLTERSPYSDMPEVLERFARVIEYNLPRGKKHRPIALITTYKFLEDPKNLTPENIRLANIMGWCVELMQASGLIVDDVLDASETRRGMPCWYKGEDVGLLAINDAHMLEMSSHLLLRKYFKGHHCYNPSQELFVDVMMKTTVGEALDGMSKMKGKPNYNYFTKKIYNSIAKYKCAYHASQLPIVLAMYLAGEYNHEIHTSVHTVLMEIGKFYQIQNDVLDCFADPKATGKIGTDIAEGKCSWLAVTALERATPTQQQILKENYGRSEPECIATVRNLYGELDLLNVYATYKNNSYSFNQKCIQKISKETVRQFLYKFLDRMYMRER